LRTHNRCALSDPWTVSPTQKKTKTVSIQRQVDAWWPSIQTRCCCRRQRPGGGMCPPLSLSTLYLSTYIVHAFLSVLREYCTRTTAQESSRSTRLSNARVTLRIADSRAMQRARSAASSRRQGGVPAGMGALECSSYASSRTTRERCYLNLNYCRFRT
jgi:hypothetical protein